MLLANVADFVSGEEDSSGSTATHQKNLSSFLPKLIKFSHQHVGGSGKQVTNMIPSSKVLTLANRDFEVNQSILVYDPTMDFKCMQKP